MPVKFGAFLPFLGVASGEAITCFAQRAEALGLDSVWSADHLMLPFRSESRYPFSLDGRFPVPADAPFIELFTTLTWAAAVTQRVRLGTAVAILPLRHPVLTAKVTATMDALSGGRLIFGAGVGWLAEEFEALDAPAFHQRGQASDEQLQIIKLLWTEREPRFQGRIYQLESTGSFPKPVQRPHPPVWIGGNSDAALRRTARFGDGWLPALFHLGPPELASRIAQLRDAAGARGRDPSGIQVALRVNMNLQPDADPERCLQGSVLFGAPERIATELDSYVRVGVSYLVIAFQAPGAEAQLRALERFVTEVQPLLTPSGSQSAGG